MKEFPESTLLRKFSKNTNNFHMNPHNISASTSEGMLVRISKGERKSFVNDFLGKSPKETVKQILKQLLKEFL